MTTQSPENAACTFRNFNLCPHCQLQGEQALLGRLCEGLPMISRSDGKLYHLLLADRPIPYPKKNSASPTRRVAVCFWYSHVRWPMTRAAIVIVRSLQDNRSPMFRVIETVADLLAEELSRRGDLAEFYDLTGDFFPELAPDSRF